MHFSRIVLAIILTGVTGVTGVSAQVPGNPLDIPPPYQPGSSDISAGHYRLALAPEPGPLILEKGDRLAIIGDSITEQKMYSRIIETYLTACAPQLEVSVRQFGWSGETAEGFLRRMESDCLRFEPTVATLCYGMNDHRYRTYTPENATWYYENYSSVVTRLKNQGARVILGSPGNVGKVPHWTNSADYTLQQLNANLATLRNIDISIAREQNVRFADIFWPMLFADQQARNTYGSGYAVPGQDGVHPGWSGQLIMAWAFLRSMGLEGDIATIRVNLEEGLATASPGHKIVGLKNGIVTVASSRYPFCAKGARDRDDSIRSGMTLVPFNQELNRFKLVVKGTTDGASYGVTWGEHTNIYTASQLEEGINLAEDYEINPFSEAFRSVDEAVAAKQSYETRQIKQMFHSPEFRADPESVVKLTEEVRTPLVRAISQAMVPVTHAIKIAQINN